MSSERLTILTATLSQSGQHLSNCATQFNSSSIEIHIIVTTLPIGKLEMPKNGNAGMRVRGIL